MTYNQGYVNNKAFRTCNFDLRKLSRRLLESIQLDAMNRSYMLDETFANIDA